MKNLIARILTPLSLTVLLLAGNVHAQYAPRTIKVTVPFEFSAGKATFPAGDYAVVRVSPIRLELRDWQSRVLASMLTIPVESVVTPKTPRLEFSTAEGGHDLRRVWMENEHAGYELQRPRAGSAVAKRRSSEPVQTASGSR